MYRELSKFESETNTIFKRHIFNKGNQSTLLSCGICHQNQFRGFPLTQQQILRARSDSYYEFMLWEATKLFLVTYHT